jgi:hypothetical protein
MSDDHERVPLDPNLFGEAQGCFGCGPHNTVGMQLRFFREGDAVTTTFEPREGWDTQSGRALLSGTASYVSPSADAAERMLGQALAPEWRSLARPAGD